MFSHRALRREADTARGLTDLVEWDWGFRDATTGYLTHNFHPYSAKFIPQIPNRLISHLSKEGDVVLDPFAGSGTSLVEAVLLRRRAIGVDVNPLACLIAKVKATPLSNGQLRIVANACSQISTSIAELRGLRVQPGRREPVGVRSEPPTIPNMEHWFQPHVVDELTIATSVIRGILDVEARQFMEVALSSIIVKVSNQDSETRYTAAVRKSVPRGTIASLLQKKTKDMAVRTRALSARVSGSRCMVAIGDARWLPVREERIHLVVTSPPYLNAWDYHLYHRFRMMWLGYDTQALRKREIGAHLTHSYNEESAERYADDMRQCLREMHRVLVRDRYACLVIGDSILRGERVESHSVLADAAVEEGFGHVATIDRTIAPTSKGQNPRIARLEREHILLLQKRR